MFKKISILILIFAIANCSKDKNKIDVSDSKDLKDLPMWVIDSSDSRGISAVGIAKSSRGGIKFQIPKVSFKIGIWDFLYCYLIKF